jgi:hypothetical protein
MRTRLNRALYGVTCGITAVAYSACALSASMAGVTSHMRKTAQCMFEVLKRDPRVDHVRLGLTNDQDGVEPFLEYRAAPEQGHRATIRFVVQIGARDGEYVDDPTTETIRFVRKRPAPDDDNFSFITVLDGMSAEGGPGPSDWGTEAMAKKWKRECGASAGALFE